jgi:methionyl aminopeptidase
MNPVVPSPLANLRPQRPPRRLPGVNDTCWCGSGDKYKVCHRDLDASFAQREAQWLAKHKIQKGTVSPMLPVPTHIERPDYIPSGIPKRKAIPATRTADEIERMRIAGKLAAEVLYQTASHIRPGITTDELDRICHQLICDAGAYPSTVGYRGFTKSVCTSVNEVICHGVPDSRALEDGDIVNLDVTVFIGGVHGDTNATFLVGDVDPDGKKLVDVTYESLMRGIAAVRPGRPISDIGKAIEDYATKFGYSVVRNYCGHGIGPVFHTDLQIPHYFDPRISTKMLTGMTFTIEPMISEGTWKESNWKDGWTVVTADLRRSAQFEHTILVTDKGAEILTPKPV